TRTYPYHLPYHHHPPPPPPPHHHHHTTTHTPPSLTSLLALSHFTRLSNQNSKNEKMKMKSTFLSPNILLHSPK
ncbi:hypothetical protein AWRI1631_47570, partial [Saccharomyces cerevisiae AWRI1631]